jgi:hypothetical protein
LLTPGHDSGNCPICCDDVTPAAHVDRRDFLKTTALTGAALATTTVPAAYSPRLATGADAPTGPSAEADRTLVTQLYESLSPAQHREICFAWNHVDDRGVLRTHVANNWQITGPKIGSEFFTRDQQDMIEAIFWSLYQPEWHDRIRKQLRDDAGGYGKQQSIALFGTPGSGQFEFVMTGRHLTIRCDGDTTEQAAFGGPIFYGHAAEGFNEKPNHPGNVFWPQALKANSLYELLDGKQRERSLVKPSVEEFDIGFQGPAGRQLGLAMEDLSADQLKAAEAVLDSLLDPFRLSDREEVRRCLADQGGLKKCWLSYYPEEDLGNDQLWDVWRIEGPSFVWHYRGDPHVHVWVNVASSSDFQISTSG